MDRLFSKARRAADAPVRTTKVSSDYFRGSYRSGAYRKRVYKVTRVDRDQSPVTSHMDRKRARGDPCKNKTADAWRDISRCSVTTPSSEDLSENMSFTDLRAKLTAMNKSESGDSETVRDVRRERRIDRRTRFPGFAPWDASDRTDDERATFGTGRRDMYRRHQSRRGMFQFRRGFLPSYHRRFHDEPPSDSSDRDERRRSHDLRKYTVTTLGLRSYDGDIQTPTQRGGMVCRDGAQADIFLTRDDVLYSDFILQTRAYFDGLTSRRMRELTVERIFSISHAPSLQIALALADETCSYMAYHFRHGIPVNTSDPYVCTAGAIRHSLFNKLSTGNLTCLLGDTDTSDGEYQLLRLLANRPVAGRSMYGSAREVQQMCPSLFKNPLHRAMGIVAAFAKAATIVKRSACVGGYVKDQFLDSVDENGGIKMYEPGMLSKLVLDALRTHRCENATCQIRIAHLLAPYKLSMLFCPLSDNCGEPPNLAIASNWKPREQPAGCAAKQCPSAPTQDAAASDADAEADVAFVHPERVSDRREKGYSKNRAVSRGSESKQAADAKRETDDVKEWKRPRGREDKKGGVAHNDEHGAHSSVCQTSRRSKSDSRESRKRRDEPSAVQAHPSPLNRGRASQTQTIVKRDPDPSSTATRPDVSEDRTQRVERPSANDYRPCDAVGSTTIGAPQTPRMSLHPCENMSDDMSREVRITSRESDCESDVEFDDGTTRADELVWIASLIPHGANDSMPFREGGAESRQGNDAIPSEDQEDIMECDLYYSELDDEDEEDVD